MEQTQGEPVHGRDRQSEWYGPTRCDRCCRTNRAGNVIGTGEDPAPQPPALGEAVDPGHCVFPGCLTLGGKPVELVKATEADVLGKQHQPRHPAQLQVDGKDQPREAQPTDGGAVELLVLRCRAA